MEIVVVERSFESPTTGKAVLAGGRDIPGCLKAHRVTLRQSHISADGRRMLCVFEAPDAESVRIANLQAGLPFVRVWTADLEEGG
jgi:Nickel responsive protein SCO4226-like